MSNKKFLLNDIHLKKPTSHPDVWGPNLWNYLHISTAHFPDNPTEQQKSDMISWICTLPVTIPCDTCRNHFKSYIDSNRHRLQYICGSKSQLFNFFVDIHNKVNQRKGKPEMSYDDAYNLYFTRI